MIKRKRDRDVLIAVVQAKHRTYKYYGCGYEHKDVNKDVSCEGQLLAFKSNQRVTFICSYCEREFKFSPLVPYHKNNDSDNDTLAPIKNNQKKEAI